LQKRRLDGERQAETALAGALAELRRAEARDAELESAAVGARSAWAAARTGAPLPTTAVEAAAQFQYGARLEAAVKAALGARDTHRAGALALAIRDAEAARAAHLVARQRREVVDKALARRAAAERLDRERRTEAELDDRARPPRG
jgi:hypothetical protein